MVETIPSLNTTVNDPFSLTCYIRAELDRHPLNTTIQWIHIFHPANIKETLKSLNCIPSDTNSLQVNEKSCRLRMGAYRDRVKRKGDKIVMGL